MIFTDAKLADTPPGQILQSRFAIHAKITCADAIFYADAKNNTIIPPPDNVKGFFVHLRRFDFDLTEMENLTYILFNLGFVIIFVLLGIFMLLLYIPKDELFRNYRKGRLILGTGFIIMAVYCIIRILIPQSQHDYTDFFLQLVFSFIFSWLNYSSFLFFMDSSNYRIRHFLLDGMIPVGLMAITGTTGLFIPVAQKYILIAFGILFGIKCCWMFYICMREYRACVGELDNYYDRTPDIRWIRNLIWLTAALSISTIMAMYIPQIHIVYDVVAPGAYVYMVFRIVNFVPAKIDKVRAENASMETRQKPASTPAVLPDRLEEQIAKWTDTRNFCRPNLNIKDVSKEIGTNSSYLSSYLNNCLGVTFQVWLNTLRVEESKTLLLDERRLSIEEVGAAVGFPQSYNFSKWFKTVTGTTPFRFRQHNQNLSKASFN